MVSSTRCPVRLHDVVHRAGVPALGDVRPGEEARLAAGGEREEGEDGGADVHGEKLSPGSGPGSISAGGHSLRLRGARAPPIPPLATGQPHPAAPALAVVAGGHSLRLRGARAPPIPPLATGQPHPAAPAL